MKIWFWKCDFSDKRDFENAIFVKNVILKIWILLQKCDFEKVNFVKILFFEFLDKMWKFTPVCESAKRQKIAWFLNFLARKFKFMNFLSLVFWTNIFAPIFVSKNFFYGFIIQEAETESVKREGSVRSSRSIKSTKSAKSSVSFVSETASDQELIKNGEKKKNLCAKIVAGK